MVSQLRRIVSWIIGRLPSSKRSIVEVREQLSTIQTQISRLQECVDARCAHLEVGQYNVEKSLRAEILTNREQSSIMAWSNYRKDGESSVDAHKRFFLSLPKATGSMRVIQRGCASLLSEFAQIAQQHNLQYWADFGTLLGCVRHRGFIPWDDDVDLGMMREDIDKLLTMLREDAALCARYRAVLVYDPYVCCRQLRFRYANNSNPCFLDIFFYDYAPDLTSEQQQSFVSLRKDLQQELRSQTFFNAWLDCGYVEQGGEYTASIEQIFQSFQKKAVSQGLVVSKSCARNVVYGLDNVDAENLYLAQCSEMFPVKMATFEDFSVAIPQLSENILERVYGDIYQLPSDIITHFRHVDCESLHSSHTDDVIEQDIRSNPYAIDCGRLE